MPPPEPGIPDPVADRGTVATDSTTDLDPDVGARLAARLESNEQAIVEAWTRAVRADPRIRSDESLSYAEFVDHIPKVVREVCRLLRGAPPAAERPLIRAEARVHGAFRWRQGYDLTELMREIAHLRAVLVDLTVRGLEEIGIEHSRQPALLGLLLRTLDEGQVETVARYVAERDHEIAERDRDIADRDRDIADRDRRLQQHLLERERSRVEALESAARAKDDFLATLSHELRTPLTPILAWVTILERSELPERVEGAVRTIGRNARVLIQLIDDLLDVSRIVSGKLDFVPEPIDARDFVRAACETVQPLAAAKGIALRVEEPTAPLPVLGDATRLQQVIWNLLSNAVKFSRPGGAVRIHATALERDPGAERGQPAPPEAQARAAGEPAGAEPENARAQGGPAAEGEVCVAISDDGAGIDPEFLPYVFDRFSQQDQRATRWHGGLGLGLAIARAIAVAHGGFLTASSDGPGKGSRFELHLPLGSRAPLSSASPD